jgi:NAD(P)-dependent dehydrogenase (short-subunit alcohol dehydrogenase family)
MSNENTARPRIFLVTGANNGIGLEATRQLVADENHKVYMLCRSEQRAKAAIAQIGAPKNVKFVEFDAYSTDAQNTANLILEDTVHGVLLNAGGFGETLEASSGDGASKLAQLNLLAHVALVKELINQQKLREGSRILAAGSEACFTTSVPKFDWNGADFKKHLQGKVPVGPTKYGWIKGIVALYWSAFARHHPELYVVTVSPGAVKGTDFYNQKGVPAIADFGSKVLTFFNGSHSVEDGAMRYLDSLLDIDNSKEIPSGSFLAHRKGFAKDFGDIKEHPRGDAFGDSKLQELVWEAVEGLLAAGN